MTIFDKVYHLVISILEFLLSFSILFAVCTSSELGRPTQFFLLGCAALIAVGASVHIRQIPLASDEVTKGARK